MIKICKNCGKEFQTKQSRTLFCSCSCSVTFNNKSRKHSKETKRKISESVRKGCKKRLFKCKNCGKEYEYEKGVNTKDYCCKGCSRESRDKRAKKFVVPSEYYVTQGYERLYITRGNDDRDVAHLYKADKTNRSMTYAKYLYTSFYRTDVPEGCDVDHKDGNKLNNDIENLQVISSSYNRKKDHRVAIRFIDICPICGREFVTDRYKHQIGNVCCSRSCGYKKAQTPP